MKYKSEIENQFRKFIARPEENAVDQSDEIISHHRVGEYVVLVTFLHGYTPFTDNELWEGLITSKIKDLTVSVLFTQIKITEEIKFELGCGYIAKVVNGNFKQLAYNRYPDYTMGYGESALQYDLGLNGIWNLIDERTGEAYPFPSYELCHVAGELKSIKQQRLARRLIQQVSEHFDIDKKLVKEVLESLK